jgi:threonine/homoserine efflux transporter RhtA
MDNILGAALGVVLLLASIACFPIGFALQSTNDVFLPIFFGLGILLLSAALPVPIFLLDRLDGRS